MNDNLPPQVLHRHGRDRIDRSWLQELQELRDIGIRAVAKPESLTMGEIQEIAWGFLMAAGSFDDVWSKPR